jgi:16S rRNA (guanine527-N7)-methyltransferase
MATLDLVSMLERVGVFLETSQIGQLEWLAAELLRWNSKRNLTAITNPVELYEKHLVDSLLILSLLPASGALLDIGSGAGFPALPLKIARPELLVVSLDSVAKKIAFQRHAARGLGLRGFEAVHARAEDFAGEVERRGAFDVITARALTSLEGFVTLASPFVAPGGCLLAMKGIDAGEELRQCQSELIDAGWSVESRELRLPLSGAKRFQIVLRRVL